MPSVELIIWSAISGLILLMLAVIGWLVKTGFDGLRKELKALWDKLDKNQDETSKLREEVAELRARCEERSKHCKAVA